MMEDLTKWCERAVELGADKATAIGTDQVVAAEWVRLKCLYGCDEPGVYKTCPPNGAPSVEQTKRVLGEFERAVLLGVGPIVGEDKSDAESRRLNDAALALERELFLAGFHKAWTMGAGPCDICSACAQGKDCPTPEKARPVDGGLRRRRLHDRAQRRLGDRRRAHARERVPLLRPRARRLSRLDQSIRLRLSSSALTATRMLDPDIETAAISGRSVRPSGAKTPAAMGRAREL